MRIRRERHDYCRAFQSNAIVELWTPPEETVAATIAKQEAWAVESIAYLRRFIGD
ncbi:MAG: hypothetical protein ACUVWR_06710 [Anaerolineae bacterium]